MRWSSDGNFGSEKYLLRYRKLVGAGITAPFVVACVRENDK